jgi:vacuolar-type H+-ATPase subunit I/STV1
MEVSSTTINSIGLIADIAGAIFLLFFGIPEQVSFRGTIATNSFEYSERQQGILRCRKALARTGLALLICGFALQLISNYW